MLPSWSACSGRRRPRRSGSRGPTETVTLPSCEARLPTPSPARMSGHVTTSGPDPTSRTATRITIATNSSANPMRTTRRGEALGKSLGTPTAAASRAIDSGSRRTPVATAERPRATERKSGMTKNSPACSRNWKKNDVSPAWSLGTRSMVGSTSAPLFCRTRLPSQNTKSVRTAPPPRMSQTTGEVPSHCGASGLGGRIPTSPRGSLRIPPSRGRPPRGGSRSGRGGRRVSRGASATRLERTRMTSDQHDLSGEDHAPGEIGRAEASNQRTCGDGDRASRGDQAVGARTLRRAEVGGDQAPRPRA